MSQIQKDQTKSIPLPPIIIGKLIGKGGSEIKSIRDKSGANVMVRDNSAIIIGLADQIEKAEKLINKIIEDARPYKTRMSKTIQIPQGQVRILIGPGGRNVNSIQTKSGAYIKVMTKAGGPRTDDVEVEIMGTEAQILQAQQLILEAVSVVGLTTEMTIVQDLKIRLKNLDEKVRQNDIFDLYKDAHSHPTVTMRVAKEGDKLAVLAFQSKSEMQTWMNQLRGKLLCGRKIVKG